MLAKSLENESISILMIEDSRNEARIMYRLLNDTEHEFSISLVSRLDDAFTELTQRKKDVIILDLGLPDSNGPESVKILRQRYPNLPIVVISGHNDTATVQQTLEYGAQEFVSKNECSGSLIRQAIMGAIIRKTLKK